MNYSLSPTKEILMRAMDACALKQAVYSANIANANVEGYRRLEVMFDAEAMRTEVAGNTALQHSATFSGGATQPEVVMATDFTVKLDEEMAAMARNALQYQTLLGAYQRSIGILKLAVNDGREV